MKYTLGWAMLFAVYALAGSLLMAGVDTMPNGRHTRHVVEAIVLSDLEE